MAIAGSMKYIQCMFGFIKKRIVITGTSATVVCAWNRGSMPANIPAIMYALLFFFSFFVGFKSMRIANAIGMPKRKDRCGRRSDVVGLRKWNPSVSVPTPE